ncbi:insulinase family protein [Cupriavidus basilensis]
MSRTCRPRHKNGYVPDNVLLVVTGDVTAAEVRTLAERIYGKLKARPLPLRKDRSSGAGHQADLGQGPRGEPVHRDGVQGAAPARRRGRTSNPYALEVLSAVLNGFLRDNARLTRETWCASAAHRRY